jgi:3-oxoacyl-[acyl-carrier protein] reductase
MSGNNQVALVTGAGRGIGRAIALRLAQDGMKVAIVSRSAAELAETNKLSGGRMLVLVGDVAAHDDVMRVVRETEAELGPIDLLVNNAGTTEPREAPLWESEIEGWWRVIEVNLKGPMMFMHSVLGSMVKRNSGRVVNIGSLRAVTAIPVQTAHGASKAAMARLTHTVNTSLAGTNVHIFELSPGRVLTELVKNSSAASVVAKASADSWSTPEQVAGTVSEIATGGLDALSGRFLHARDDVSVMKARAAEIVANDGRVLRFSKAYEGDPMRYPGEAPRRNQEQ